MKYNKTFETAGFAAITATVFVAVFIIYFNVFQQMIYFLLTWQGNGIYQYR